MQDQPRLGELIATVRDFLQREVAPEASNARLRFRALIAGNLLDVVGRELELEPSLLRQEYSRLSRIYPEQVDFESDSQRDDLLRQRIRALSATLAADLRKGRLETVPGDAVWNHVRDTVVDKLRVANPRLLDRFPHPS